MQPNVALTKKQTRAPGIARVLQDFFFYIDEVFDRLYGSRYNPLHQSGTLACGLLLIVLVTGLYLIFFFQLSAPYESIAAINQDRFLGAWIRSLHRFASDLSVVAVVFHTMRMLAEGKTWGPRVLAWISGVVMLGILLFSGWTGYILVWDYQGQDIAIFGAKMIDRLNLLPSPLNRAFSGVTTLQNSFFFMNLFLHVAIPLGLILALWIHTKRLARSAWLPPKKMFHFLIFSLFLFCVLWISPLGKKADLLQIDRTYPLDLFFNFWLPWQNSFSPLWVGLLLIGGFFVLSLVPWFWKPHTKPETSSNDQMRCTGCTQCATDCPFEAITMIPRTAGSGSELVSSVNADLCVSCGLCAGSCTQFAIGPQARAGRDQLGALKSWLEPNILKKGGVVIIHCFNNPADKKLVALTEGLHSRVVPCGVECIGSVHPGVVVSLLKHFDGVFFLSCPPRLCQFREGIPLASSRLFDDRSPGLPENIDRNRIFIFSGTASDQKTLESQFIQFCKAVDNGGQKVVLKIEDPKRSVLQHAFALAASLLIFAVVGIGSQVSSGLSTNNAYLRLGWGLPGQVYEHCRELSAQEIANLPMHMRKAKECTQKLVSYDLSVWIDDNLIQNELYHPRGARADRPLFIDQLIKVTPGEHLVKVQFIPNKSDITEQAGGELKAISLQFSQKLQFEMGRANLISLDTVTKELFLKAH